MQSGVEETAGWHPLARQPQQQQQPWLLQSLPQHQPHPAPSTTEPPFPRSQSSGHALVVLVALACLAVQGVRCEAWFYQPSDKTQARVIGDRWGR